jgi:hypothetical protein
MPHFCTSFVMLVLDITLNHKTLPTSMRAPAAYLETNIPRGFNDQLRSCIMDPEIDEVMPNYAYRPTIRHWIRHNHPLPTPRTRLPANLPLHPHTLAINLALRSMFATLTPLAHFRHPQTRICTTPTSIPLRSSSVVSEKEEEEEEEEEEEGEESYIPQHTQSTHHCSAYKSSRSRRRPGLG